ncbi:hypothetical protein ACNF40_07465 [Cuniculiplasma sp. SKW4]|uniref:hypothetical protein n=1 Tax=Cuniculiplasma sp. SKW4 TaxID=3400171 RepID=UPI003FD3D606
MVIQLTGDREGYLKVQGNTFGFYSLKGKSVVDFQDHSRKENIITFLKTIGE